LNQNATLPNGVATATMALGGNEPDQVGFCQNYTHSDHEECNGFKMRDGQCTGKAECRCTNWSAEHGCLYEVTGAGMWPIATAPEFGCTGQPFPFWCFGKGKKLCGANEDSKHCCSTNCRAGMQSAFKNFYMGMADKGYTYATTPIAASDLTFVQEMMEAQGCASDEMKKSKGQERLKQGCPTHSAFHFYSVGCPKDPDSVVKGLFDARVHLAKKINAKFGLEGTIVNELGSLKNTDTDCKDEEIALMMSKMFEFLQSEEGRGVVSQMVWFNEDQTGGTFDLRLVKDGKLSMLGETYKTACTNWAQDNGIVAELLTVV